MKNDSHPAMKEECRMQKDKQRGTTDPALSSDETVLQESLFTGEATVISELPHAGETPFPPLVRTNPLTDQSSLTACALPYQQDLVLRGKSNYTVTCFLSDLKMFTSFVGADTP